MSASSVLSAIAPQFDSQANRDTFLTLAENKTNRCLFGVNADEAVALRAAHMMTLATRTLGEAGAVSSKKEGNSSINYVAGAGHGISGLDQTYFGKQLKQLIAQSGPAVGITGGYLSYGC
jgi:hypothetical protein